MERTAAESSFRTLWSSYRSGDPSSVISSKLDSVFWISFRASRAVLEVCLKLVSSSEKKPPFLENANLENWEAQLDVLISKEYKEYKQISSRDGQISERDIKNMKKFLSNIRKQFERLARRKAAPQATEKMVERSLGMFDFSSRYQTQYYQRLKYGFQNCYARQYYSTN